MFYYNNRVDVLGRKYVFGPTEAHFHPSRSTASDILNTAGIASAFILLADNKQGTA